MGSVERRVDGHVCDPLNREATMVVVERNEHGKPTVWCDPCLVTLVRALNAAGIRTVASCCGHGYRPGLVMLDDGRSLVIVRDDEERRRIEALFPVDINGEENV